MNELDVYSDGRCPNSLLRAFGYFCPFGRATTELMVQPGERFTHNLPFLQRRLAVLVGLVYTAAHH